MNCLDLTVPIGARKSTLTANLFLAFDTGRLFFAFWGVDHSTQIDLIRTNYFLFFKEPP